MNPFHPAYGETEEKRLAALRTWAEGHHVTVVVEIFGVTPDSLYKWRRRYEAHGIAPAPSQKDTP